VCVLTLIQEGGTGWANHFPAKSVALKRLRWLRGDLESCQHLELFCRAIISPQRSPTHPSSRIDRFGYGSISDVLVLTIVLVVRLHQ
jgi:hypothetical protein